MAQINKTTIKTFITQTLKDNLGKKLSSSEIAKIFFDPQLERFKDKDLQQITNEVSRDAPHIKNVYSIPNERPYKFYYSENTDKDEIEEEVKEKQTEHDLYPMLSEYLSSINILSMRIDEKKSSNRQGKNGNKWLHPDVVGVKDLSKNFNKTLKDLSSTSLFDNVLMYSFEVKINIRKSNLREYFFQTVSNSSWANLSYLVVENVHGNDTYTELENLCSAHSIGLITLNVDSPTDSIINIHAKEKDKLDWNMMNRLVDENEDFTKYITKITIGHKGGEFDEDSWK